MNATDAVLATFIDLDLDRFLGARCGSCTKCSGRPQYMKDYQKENERLAELGWSKNKKKRSCVLPIVDKVRCAVLDCAHEQTN